jgi:hypothetical protein
MADAWPIGGDNFARMIFHPRCFEAVLPGSGTEIRDRDATGTRKLAVNFL